MKYRIPTPEVADDIWNDKLFFSYEEDGIPRGAVLHG